MPRVNKKVLNVIFLVVLILIFLSNWHKLWEFLLVLKHRVSEFEFTVERDPNTIRIHSWTRSNSVHAQTMFVNQEMTEHLPNFNKYARMIFTGWSTR